MGGFLLGQVMDFCQVSRIRPSEDNENIFDPYTHAACVYTVCRSSSSALYQGFASSHSLWFYMNLWNCILTRA